MWFSASLFYRARHSPESDNDWLWEERIVLIAAPDLEQAAESARVLGKAEEHEYATENGRLRWEFVRLERVTEIEGALESGTELFWRFVRQTEADSLLDPFD